MLALSGNALALEIGTLKADSHLGEAFRASLKIIPSPDETIDASCVSIGQGQRDSDVFQLKHAKLGIQPGKGFELIRITTSESVNEPIVTLSLNIHCGNQGEFSKSFTVFLDPAPASQPSPPAVPLPEEKAAAIPEMKPKPQLREKTAKKADGGTITIKPRDTLSGIAHDYFPDDKKAQNRFIAAVLDENPGLSPRFLQVGTVLRIPDLKSIGTPAPHPKAEEAPKRQEQAAAKPAFHLDIVSGEAKSDSSDLKRTETQLISRADDQAVQMLQLKEQIKTLEGKLAELQNRVVAANKLLARAGEAKPKEEAKPVSKIVWIAALIVFMGIGGVVYWYFRRKKAEEHEELLEQYLNPSLSKPALMDHLDYFESDTPDHHKW